MNQLVPQYQHVACGYESDQEFLRAATPFITDGLADGEPVLAVTTSANIELLSAALGTAATKVDYAESAFFGRRPPQRVAGFHRYWKQQAAARPWARVRILSDQMWAGRTAREIAAWTRLESAFNVVLSATGICMLCLYDARTVPPEVLADAGRTHPAWLAGTQLTASADYADPVTFADSHRPASLPEPPAAAPGYLADGDVRSLRAFVSGQAGALGLPADRAGLLVLAAGEVGGYLRSTGSQSPTVRIWEQAGAIVCHFRQPRAEVGDPFLGLRPAEPLEPRPGDGLWLASQICDWLEIRSDSAGCDIQLQVPSMHNAELTQPGARYPR